MRVRPGSSISRCSMVMISYDIHPIKIDLWHTGAGSDIKMLSRYDGGAKRFGGGGP